MAWVRLLVFVTILFAFLWGLNRLVHRRATHAFALARGASRALGWLLGSVVVILVVSRMLNRTFSENAFIEWLVRTSMTFELGIVIAAALLAPLATVEWLARLPSRWRERRWRSAPKESEVPSGASSEKVVHGMAGASPDEAESSDADAVDAVIPRRELLSRSVSGAAITMGAGSAAYGALFGRTDYEIEEVPIKLERLPAALDGFVITQLSDIHVGMYTGAPELSSAVELTRATRPDLIVLTGDLIDNDDRHAPTLGAWVRRLGGIAPVVAVAGNHDYYSGIAKTLDAVRRAGATVLLNEGVALRDGRLGSREPIRVGEVHPHLSLLGVDDVWAGRYGGPGPDLPRAAATSNPDAARLLLCHNPSSFDSFAPDIDLQLSGHTHGGQVNLGIRPADYVLPHGYVAGHYRFGRAQLYVNRGFGTVGPPARLGAAPEVTKVVLTT